MWCDVIDLCDFYKNGLGKTAQTLISHCLRGIWPNVSNERVLGLGYAIPFLETFQNEAEIQNELTTSSQNREAVKAFLEKREPNFD